MADVLAENNKAKEAIEGALADGFEHFQGYLAYYTYRPQTGLVDVTLYYNYSNRNYRIDFELTEEILSDLRNWLLTAMHEAMLYYDTQW